eukprot:2669365-Lingulodinium_polyedra.AAC.1
MELEVRLLLGSECSLLLQVEGCRGPLEPCPSRVQPLPDGLRSPHLALGLVQLLLEARGDVLREPPLDGL